MKFESSDAAVQGTTEDASISKLSSSRLGYFEDAFLHFFVKRGEYRRSPLVNRGYYSRVAGIRMVIRQFMECCEEAGFETCQVVSLGAGLDPTAFYIATSRELPNIARNTHVFEVDYPEVVKKKAAIINHYEELKSVFPPLLPEGEYRSDRYALLGADLRELDQLSERLSGACLRSNVPTLFLAECVLIYMDNKYSDAVLEWVAKKAVPNAFACIAVYEQTNPNDPFGRVMVENLKLRGCPLLGIAAYPTLQSHHRRYIDVAGFESVSIADMNDIYDNQIDKDEIKRIAKLELFDEFEEWRLMQAHYFIAVACTRADKFDKMQCMWGKKQ